MTDIFKMNERELLHPQQEGIETVECTTCGKSFEAEGCYEYGLFEPEHEVCDECRFQRMNTESNTNDEY